MWSPGPNQLRLIQPCLGASSSSFSSKIPEVLDSLKKLSIRCKGGPCPSPAPPASPPAASCGAHAATFPRRALAAASQAAAVSGAAPLLPLMSHAHRGAARLFSTSAHQAQAYRRPVGSSRRSSQANREPPSSSLVTVLAEIESQIQNQWQQQQPESESPKRRSRTEAQAGLCSAQAVSRSSSLGGSTRSSRSSSPVSIIRGAIGPQDIIVSRRTRTKGAGYLDLDSHDVKVAIEAHGDLHYLVQWMLGMKQRGLLVGVHGETERHGSWSPCASSDDPEVNLLIGKDARFNSNSTGLMRALSGSVLLMCPAADQLISGALDANTDPEGVQEAARQIPTLTFCVSEKLCVESGQNHQESFHRISESLLPLLEGSLAVGSNIKLDFTKLIRQCAEGSPAHSKLSALRADKKHVLNLAVMFPKGCRTLKGMAERTLGLEYSKGSGEIGTMEDAQVGVRTAVGLFAGMDPHMRLK